MTHAPFIGPKCQDIRAHLDSFLGGELLVETTESVQTHVDSCPACRAELDRRAALRARLRAVLTEPAGDTDALERRILAGLGDDRRPGWLSPVVPLAAAAVLVIAVVGWRSFSAPDLAGPEPAGTPPPASTATPTPAAAGAPPPAGAAPVFDLALYADTALSHTYCAVKRAMPDPPPTRTAAAEQLEAYAGLLEALDEGLEGYTVLDAHVCPNGDRRYAHLILQKGSERSSVFVTTKLAGALPPGDQTTVASGALLQLRREGEYDIAAVESDHHIGLIVGMARTTAPADASFPPAPLARDVAAYLTRIAER